MSLYIPSNIPDDIQDIIYKYKHNLEMKTICNELTDTFYECMNCNENCNEIITPIYLECNQCSKKVCLYCATNLHSGEINSGSCLECIVKNLYLKEIERILDRKLEIMEDDRFLTILQEHQLIDYEIYVLVNHLKDIQKGTYKYPQQLHDDINTFATSEWGFNESSSLMADYEIEDEMYNF